MADDESAVGDGIGLAEMIKAVRAELLEAQKDPATKDLRFATGNVELVLTVAVTKQTGGKGGFKLWVVDAGGEHVRTNATTHTFTVNLAPVDPGTGRPAEVSRESFSPPSDR